MLFSKQERYSILGAIGVAVFGWVVQLLGLPWEVIVLALGVLLWGFRPRIMRSIRSWQTSKTLRVFQTFTGGDDLLKQLEWIETRCEQLGKDVMPPTDDVRQAIIRELYHLSIELETLRGKYYGIWTDGLKNKVTIVANQLSEAGSALSGKDFEKAKAHTDAAAQTAQGLTKYLRSPPSS